MIAVGAGVCNGLLCMSGLTFIEEGYRCAEKFEFEARYQESQGYDGDADAYISKPFNSQLLLSRIHNLIANRRQLKQ